MHGDIKFACRLQSGVVWCIYTVKGDIMYFARWFKIYPKSTVRLS